MSIWLVKEELERVKLPDRSYRRTPIPTQVVSNGEYTPIPQTRHQKQVVSQINHLSGKLGKKHGLGHDHVIWGTDSVWYGSPQWQLEAFRRIELPEDMQEKFGFDPLGEGTAKIKSDILGHNAAKLYDLSKTQATVSYYAIDTLAAAKARYLKEGGEPSNMVYGFLSGE